MADTTNIEWADSTWNPWIGCSAVSPGCDNCYAADWAKRYGRDFSERTKTADWAKPKRWNAAPFLQCSSCGKRGDGLQFGLRGQGQATPQCPSCTSHDILPARRRVFPSLCDPFDNQVPEVWRAQLFALIVETPNIDWLLLTKRIGYAHKLIGGFHSVADTGACAHASSCACSCPRGGFRPCWINAAGSTPWTQPPERAGRRPWRDFPSRHTPISTTTPPMAA